MIKGEKMKNSDKVNELKDKAKLKTQELSSKLVNEENKEKVYFFLNNLLIGFLQGIKACIEWLNLKLLPKIEAKLETLKAKEQQ